jgi:hypothetical protein
MPEVLGATAVLLTVATIATISVKDTVAAGSQATMQRELQQLNTALNNFEAAGGVMPAEADADIEAALLALKEGVDLAGDSGEYASLVTDPNLAVALEGETYNLDYTPGEGFAYVPASGTGDPITGGGVLGAASGTYPFDVTDPAKVREAVQYFRGLDPADPLRQEYVNAFNVVRNLGTIPENDIETLRRDLAEADVYEINNTWAIPEPTNTQNLLVDREWEEMIKRMYLSMSQWRYANPETRDAALDTFIQNNLANHGGDWSKMGSAVFADLFLASHGDPGFVANIYLGDLSPEDRLAVTSSMTSGQLYDYFGARQNANVSNLWTGNPLLQKYAPPTTVTQWANATQLLAGEDGREQLAALRQMEAAGTIGTNWARNIDWSKVSNAQNLPLWGIDFSGTNIKGSLLNSYYNVGSPMSQAPLYGANFTGSNLSGFDPSGRSLQRSNFSAVSGLTGSDFNKASSIMAINLSNTNLTGFNAVGKRLDYVNLSGATGLTPQSLAQASSLGWANLSGTGITREALRAAMEATNWQAGARAMGAPSTLVDYTLPNGTVIKVPAGEGEAAIVGSLDSVLDSITF